MVKRALRSPSRPAPPARPAKGGPVDGATAARSAPVGRRPGRLAGRIVRLVLIGLAVLVLAPVALTAVYGVVQPPVTLLMLERLAQGHGLDRRWRPLDHISPGLLEAVIAAEDAHFCTHHGFDFEAIRAAQAHNRLHPGHVRGGSTLSQQTAKNVFLWPGRSYLRKGLEAYYTVLIEALWGKRRILEMYLNEVERGPGVYGAQAASLSYFGHDADELTGPQASRLAAILPDPLKWKAVHPGRYVARRSRRIGAAAVTIRTDDLAACVLRR